MFCTGCAQTLSDDSVYCEFCGTPRASACPDPPPAAPNSTHPLSRVQLGGLLWQGLTIGEKFIAVGAAAALVGFFFPLFSLPNLSAIFGNISPLFGGAGIETKSFSLFDVARMWGGAYFVFLGAVAAGVLFYLSGKSAASRKLLFNAFQVMIGSLAGPQMLLTVLLTPMAQQIAGLGLWMTCLGYCAIAAGGMISIVELSKRIA